MAKITKPENAAAQEQAEEIKFPVETLICSKSFKDYHPDFLRALLPNDAYSKNEAAEIVSKYFKGGNN